MAAQDIGKQDPTLPAPDWKAQFLAGLSYEVRTPLSGAVGMTDLLLETPLSAEQRDYVLTARACLDELVSLLDQSLELADLSLSPGAAAPQEFHLREALRAALPACVELHLSRGVSVEAWMAPDLPETASGDAVRLRELLSELIREAAATCVHGQVSVRIWGEPAEGFLRLNLQTKVIPQPSADSSQTGLPGSSCDKRGSRLGGRRNGLHLSWSLAYELTRLLNGSFWFGSEPGEGCVCKCIIPLALSVPGRQELEMPLGAPERNVILVVEDNEVARRVVTHILNRYAYQVDCAKDWREAIEKASARKYDLVLMDLQLPEVDGFGVSRQLRALPGYSGIPILALTANVTPEYRSLCLRHGMAGYLAKPVQPSELLEAVEQVLKR
ncbi:MAG: response regulator [Bryobacteraceae bacterium]|nr:response regulator [Bryobacteraceae bacterium]